jgi:2-C-methyl-D-erythritol 4-phosphate cytidylyltransferase / 2-C-methyl-D-erythritol 2,4-cyclodiphosphate synthase
MGADKLWLDAGDRPLIAWTLHALSSARCFDTVCVVAPSERWEELQRHAHAVGIEDLRLVEGGEHRQDSVRAGLTAVPRADHVLVHDAARPLCPPDVFHRVLDGAREYGAVTAAIPVVDSIKRVTDDARVVETLDRNSLVAVQTPQGFRADVLVAAHRNALAHAVRADDDCALVEQIGVEVRVVMGDPVNIKVTRPVDLDAVRAAVEAPA